MPRRILVVKSNPVELAKLRKDVKRAFAKDQPDLIVAGCTNMANALALVRKEKFSAIITGEHFTDGSGSALYQAIRAIPAYQQAQVVLYTGTRKIADSVTRWRRRDQYVSYVQSTQGVNRVLEHIAHLFGPNTAPNVG